MAGSFVPPDTISDPHHPINFCDMPLLIEALVNSVEVLEAILKPSHPYETYTARPIRQYRRGPLGLKMQPFEDSEGKPFQDRKIRFAILRQKEWGYFLRWFRERVFFFLSSLLTCLLHGLENSLNVFVPCGVSCFATTQAILKRKASLMKVQHKLF